MDAVEHQAAGQQQPLNGRPGFFQEFRDYWKKVPDKGLFLALLAGWCVLFQLVGISSLNFGTVRPSLFEWLYRAWNDPALDSSQGNVAPFVVAFLLWLKRRELLASIRGVWWPALLVLVAALALHVLGFLAQQQRISVIAFFLGMYALVGVAWGWRAMAASFYPLVFFAFCLPLGTFAESLTLNLRLIAAGATHWICAHALNIVVIQRGTVLFDPTGTVQYDVAAACSGIHSFVAMLAITTVFSTLVYQSLWKRALMITLTVPLVVACNVIRLVAIVFATQAFGWKDAGSFVHEWFGYVTYLLAIACLFGVDRLLRRKQPSDSLMAA